MTHPPTFRNPGDWRAIAVVGDIYRFLATGADTDGKYALWEAIVAPGGGPPPHIHSREEEGFYVLEGEVTFHLDDKVFQAGPGTFVNMPIGSLHTFHNDTDRPAKMLISVAPAGVEQMFLEVGQPVAADAVIPPPPAPDEIPRLLAAAPRYGIQIRVPLG